MTDERIIAYLLEELTEEESERFEKECFAREEWPAQINWVEEDLIDDYLRGELPPERHRRFEQNYLTTAARVERVRGATALLRHMNIRVAVAEPAGERTWAERLRAWWGGPRHLPRPAVALALVVLVVGAWWLFRLPAAHRPPQTFATLTLSMSDADRAGGAQPGRVKLTPGIDALRITLELPNASAQAAHYRVQLEDDDGAVKLSESVLREAEIVRLTIPASQLPRGRYALKLFAVKTGGTEQPIPGSYLFVVE